MSTHEMDASAVLVGLKAHFRLESDEALAARLGVAKSTIATWRRRGSIPSRAAKELESRYGLTLDKLTKSSSEDIRTHLLRRSYYFILLNVYGAEILVHDDSGSELANDLAQLEPYLQRVLIRKSSFSNYQGAVGAASFYLDILEGKLSAKSLAVEAIAEFQAEHANTTAS